MGDGGWGNERMGMEEWGGGGGNGEWGIGNRECVGYGLRTAGQNMVVVYRRRAERHLIVMRERETPLID